MIMILIYLTLGIFMTYACIESWKDRWYKLSVMCGIAAVWNLLIALFDIMILIKGG